MAADVADTSVACQCSRRQVFIGYERAHLHHIKEPRYIKAIDSLRKDLQTTFV